MTTQRTNMKKLRELLRLKFDSKLTHRQIGRALNISPGTVSYYVQAAKQAKLNWPIPAELDDKQLSALLEPAAKQLRNTPKQKVIPNWDSIHKALPGKHTTLMLLWEEYTNQYPGQHYSYPQFTRHYKAWCKKQRVTMRIEHIPGEAAYIDYAGTTIAVYNRETGKVDFQAQLFVMALGASQYTFAYASRSQRLPDWIDCHNRAFRFYGGVPLILVPDNLKAGITDSCQFEPEANPTYAELAEHYGAAIIPARPRTPQDKSIAENAVLLSSRWIIARLSRQKFYSLAALNNAIAELLDALNRRPFQKRQGSRYEQFIEIERDKLQPLPNSEYEFATISHQTVPPDYHVRLDKHYYSVPHDFVGEKVLCRVTQSTIEILYANQRVASHVRSFAIDKATTTNEHRPQSHQNYHQWTPDIFTAWAKKKGPGVANVCQQLIENKSQPAMCAKFHFGLKKLCQRFGTKRLDEACRRAIAMNCVKFRSIESILEKGLDKTPIATTVSTSPTPMHRNIRGASYYQQQPS